ncbi:hypothetical protein [Streptomyces sp. SID1143]
MTAHAEHPGRRERGGCEPSRADDGTTDVDTEPTLLHQLRTLQG